MSLLIVDDHAPFRSYMRRVLEAKGFEVVGDASDGESAVREVERLEPDAVLLDVALGPGIDGFEVARRLGRLAHPPKIVMISSRDATAYETDVASTPVLGFLSKQGFTVDALAALLADSA
ncbi:MAG: response regulator transcription factor [Aeromicrobium sp.]